MVIVLTISSDFWFNNNCSLRSCNWKIVSFNFCSLSMAFFDVFCANCSNLCRRSLKWKKSKPLAPTPLILLLSSILGKRYGERDSQFSVTVQMRTCIRFGITFVRAEIGFNFDTSYYLFMSFEIIILNE